MSLFQESGSTAEQRYDEAQRIVEMLTGVDVDKFSQQEIDFIHQIENAKTVSPKQLFWLRDIKDKCL